MINEGKTLGFLQCLINSYKNREGIFSERIEMNELKSWNFKEMGRP